MRARRCPGHGRTDVAWPGAALGYGSDAACGESAEERPEGGDGGCYDADVNFDVGPDAGGDVDP
jgi:hypothetical protein